jgi:phosphoglycolate phosphatase-like HAD superfamily hydrolase
MRLALFDIDGTLILTGGAGMRAFYRAVQQVFGIRVDREVVNPDGKTDPLIAKGLLEHFGQSERWNDESRAQLFAAYLELLEEEMWKARARGTIRILPGVMELLDQLAADRGFVIGLVTGNLEQGARIKLAAAGLAGYFAFGGYGSDSEDRTTLIRAAILRGTRMVAPAPVARAFVLGDTPLDITHGRAAGASVIAVASARYGTADLEPYHPDLLVRALAPVDTILSFMKG